MQLPGGNRLQISVFSHFFLSSSFAGQSPHQAVKYQNTGRYIDLWHIIKMILFKSLNHQPTHAPPLLNVLVWLALLRQHGSQPNIFQTFSHDAEWWALVVRDALIFQPGFRSDSHKVSFLDALHTDQIEFLQVVKLRYMHLSVNIWVRLPNCTN